MSTKDGQLIQLRCMRNNVAYPRGQLVNYGALDVLCSGDCSEGYSSAFVLENIEGQRQKNIDPIYRIREIYLRIKSYHYFCFY